MGRIKIFDEEVVLDKAMNLFWEKGYHATSAQDLVTGLCISRSSLYDTFGLKHSLYVKALLKYKKEWIDPVLSNSTVITDPTSDIKRLFDFAKKETFDLNQRRGCFWANAAFEMAPSDPDALFDIS